ncbi:hypothetical protein QFZ99_004662 [Paraburkholderia atlantica]|uniref:hypothetical protein n=1 Tax=Paraburkholderia atlantica TaxID=2654982 RepID=UPI003D1CE0A3
MSTVLYVLTLVIVITGMDVLIFRDRFRAADGERRDCPTVRRLLSAIHEDPVSARALQQDGKRNVGRGEQSIECRYAD